MTTAPLPKEGTWFALYPSITHLIQLHFPFESHKHKGGVPDHHRGADGGEEQGIRAKVFESTTFLCIFV